MDTVAEVSQTAREYVERPVVFGRYNSLVGVVCTPVSPRDSRPTVVMLNSGIVHHVGPNRLYVRLARRLASSGVASIRFDLSGIGDSPPKVDGAETPAAITERDIDDTLGFLDDRGLGDAGYVPLGLCSGADNAYRTLVSDHRAVGAVLLDPDIHLTLGYHLRHFGRRLMRPSMWANLLTLRHPRLRGLLRLDPIAGEIEEAEYAMAATQLPSRKVMASALRELVARRAALFYLFTAGLEERYNYRRQFLDVFRDVDFADRLTLDYFDDSDHTFSQPASQARLLERVVDWVEHTSFPPPSR